MKYRIPKREIKRDVTLCLLVTNTHVLLAMKIRGFGKGKWNGSGGKRKESESIPEAAVRELKEEICVESEPEHLEYVGKLNFFFHEKPEWDQIMHIYLVREWKGDPKKSEEMIPRWFEIKNLPENDMWEGDRHWMPRILGGEKLKGNFLYNPEDTSVLNHNLEPLD